MLFAAPVRLGNLAELLGDLLGAFDMLCKVAQRNDTDRLTVFVEHRHSAELALTHRRECLLDVLVGAAADDFGRHHLATATSAG